MKQFPQMVFASFRQFRTLKERFEPGQQGDLAGLSGGRLPRRAGGESVYQAPSSKNPREPADSRQSQNHVTIVENAYANCRP